ncbi:hypothetical protein NDU88_006953 [Pleurodeles waltl]|uniref:Uncharacterized protein n=1 Tax=Pleurodeles waltl TaxID=8319 RepID=A0AAV7N5J9_PLEWA|nr:hypothetical protein NDU88_006953 [Pleurodeles waltl]
MRGPACLPGPAGRECWGLVPAGLGARGGDPGQRHWIGPRYGRAIGVCRPAVFLGGWVPRVGLGMPCVGGSPRGELLCGLALGPGGLGDVAGQFGQEEFIYLPEQKSPSQP